MALLLFLFIVAIGTATFIENSYDTITARVVIFNAKWFEFILVLLLINFTYNIKRYGLFSKKKWTMLTIHIGFIVVILGAGVTRYFGYEGVMLIPEKESSNSIFTSDPYFQVFAHNEKQQLKNIIPTRTEVGLELMELVALRSSGYACAKPCNPLFL